MATFVKDPEAVLDYVIDWATWLDGDTIATSEWAAVGGITIEQDSHTSTIATVWLSGGVAGGWYTVTNHITTADGREDDRSIQIKGVQQ